MEAVDLNFHIQEAPHGCYHIFSTLSKAGRNPGLQGPGTPQAGQCLLREGGLRHSRCVLKALLVLVWIPVWAPSLLSDSVQTHFTVHKQPCWRTTKTGTNPMETC